MSGKITAQTIKSLLKESQVGKHAIGNGLYFRISKEGTGFWMLRYSIHGKRREYVLGRYPEMSLADANLATVTTKAEISKGTDPAAERKRADQTQFETVDDLATDWLADCDKRLKHPQIPRRVYTKDLAPYIGSLTISQVSARDIRAIINRVANSGRPTVANDALLYCKQLFRHAIKLDLTTHNPAEAFTMSDAGGVEQSRSRTLSLDEIKIAFECFHKYKDQFARENTLAVALLLCLGVRKGELIGARWEEFDFESRLWHLPDTRSKTGVAISIPLADEVIEWLRELNIRACGSEYVFPKRRASIRNGHISPDTLNAAIQKLFREDKLPLEHFTVHDLRRTCRSLLAAEGVLGHVAERCLNHKLKGVEGIYDRYDYLEERRAALELLAKIIVSFANGSGALPFSLRIS